MMEQQAATPLALLLVDDNPDDRILVAREIRKVLATARIDEVGDAAGLDALLAGGSTWDVVVTDYQLGWSTGLEVYRRLQVERPGVPVILFTDSGSEEIAVAALQEGMADYITKTPRHYGRVPYAARAAAERWERRRAAEAAVLALRRQQDLLQLALEAAGMDTWELDTATGQLVLHGRSPAFFGGVDRAIALEAIRPLLEGEDDARVLEEFVAAGREGRRFDAEFRVRVDGRTRWLRAAGLPVPPGRVVGVLEDVTRRREMLEQLRESDQRKDQFIATLGHELRNPLGPIRYAAQLLQRNPDAGVKRAADVIGRQVQGMAALLDQLLDLSRISHGLIVLRREPLDLRALVQATVADVQPWAHSAQRHVTVDLPADPLVVDGDPVRLKQVLDNLVNNAFKFTRDGGRIALELRADGRQARVAVRDDGIGIPPDLLRRVFEPLLQLHAGPESTLRGGLGIGLALVRQIVDLHGGAVHAQSAGTDRGTTFVVTLPLAVAAAAAEEAGDAAGVSPPHGGLRVLAADDHPDAVDLVAETLALDGHTVRVARDGAQAQAIAAEWQPDVMVLDIGMPHLSGDEVARWARAQPWGDQVRLVAMTGWGRAEDRARLKAAGFDVHLVKPVEARQLLAALRPAP